MPRAPSRRPSSSIEDIKEGDGAEAKAGQTVSVNYVGALFKDGTVFDNSWDRGGADLVPARCRVR